jgi:hypothetical protein
MNDGSNELGGEALIIVIVIGLLILGWVLWNSANMKDDDDKENKKDGDV